MNPQIVKCLGQRASFNFTTNQNSHTERVGIQPRRENDLRRILQTGKRSDPEIHEKRKPAPELRPHLCGHDEASATLLSQRTSTRQVAGQFKVKYQLAYLIYFTFYPSKPCLDPKTYANRFCYPKGIGIGGLEKIFVCLASFIDDPLARLC